MTSEADVNRARMEAALARERLLGSAHELQARLKPAALASDAWESVRDKSEEAAAGAVAAASRRPAVATAAAIGVAALVARKPLARLWARIRGKRNLDDGDEE